MMNSEKKTASSNKLLLQAWTIQKRNNEYFLPYTHWVYLREIIKYYQEVVLLSPCKRLDSDEHTTAVSIKEFINASVYELPYSKGGYLGAIKHFFSYQKAYKSIKGVTTYYSRYPTPFGWLQKVYANKNVRRIIHYVGDPVDAAMNNPNFSKIKIRALTCAFKPENRLYDWACKGADVYTNGHHIAERLNKKGIDATPLISSTLTDNDFYFDEEKEFNLNDSIIKFVYLGGLRTAKGVETVIEAFDIFNKKHSNSELKLIGTGEHEKQLKNLVYELDNKNIEFLGRIDDRSRINEVLRKGHVFLFASLSEGSPRVILEAMANGLFVITTPVGSLPKIFNDKEELLFADYSSPESFYNNIVKVINDKVRVNEIRKRAFEKVKGYTNENFIKTIFYE